MLVEESDAGVAFTQCVSILINQRYVAHLNKIPLLLGAITKLIVVGTILLSIGTVLYIGNTVL